MFPQITVEHNIGNTITVPNQLDIRANTYTSDNVPVGTTADFPVDNASGFTGGSTILLLLSSLTMENAEIVSSTTHSDTVMTVSATRQFHSRGESVREIKWDQIVLYKSATQNGTYTTVNSPATLQVTQMNTILFDTAGLSSDYYKVQWKNSVSGLLSSLSDPISVLTYLPTSAGALFKSVLNLTGVKENDKSITANFLIEALDDGRQYVESKLYGIRQPWRQVFEFPVKVLAGSNYINLPDDIDFEDSDRSVLAARFLNNNILTPYNLMNIDKRTWNQVAFYSTGGITQVDQLIGDTSIILNSVGDFYPQGGSAQVATTDFDQEVISITYTGIDYDTNQLLGVLGLTRNVPAGTQIWSRTAMSQPIYYRVDSDRLWFSSLVPPVMQGNNLYLDYYKKMVKIENYYDVIPEHYREMYKFYLRWAIKYRKDINTPSTDPDLVKFNELVDALFANLYSGQETMIITS